MSKIALVRIRGMVKMRKEVEDTLQMLHLHNKNHASLIENTPQAIGMLAKVKDFVTYGEINDETFKQLVAKGEKYTGREQDKKGKISYSRRYIEVDGKKLKKYFRLAPPRKGYGRKGIKKPFSRGGALGNRKEKINDLLQRMM